MSRFGLSIKTSSLFVRGSVAPESIFLKESVNARRRMNLSVIFGDSELLKFR